MHWYVKVFMEDGDWYACVAEAKTPRMAEYLACKHYRDDGHEVEFASAEIFNTFEHGDQSDYEILT